MGSPQRRHASAIPVYCYVAINAAMHSKGQKALRERGRDGWEWERRNLTSNTIRFCRGCWRDLLFFWPIFRAVMTVDRRNLCRSETPIVDFEALTLIKSLVWLLPPPFGWLSYALWPSHQSWVLTCHNVTGWSVQILQTTKIRIFFYNWTDSTHIFRTLEKMFTVLLSKARNVPQVPWETKHNCRDFLSRKIKGLWHTICCCWVGLARKVCLRQIYIQVVAGEVAV